MAAARVPFEVGWLLQLVPDRLQVLQSRLRIDFEVLVGTVQLVRDLRAAADASDLQSCEDIGERLRLALSVLDGALAEGFRGLIDARWMQNRGVVFVQPAPPALAPVPKTGRPPMSAPPRPIREPITIPPRKRPASLPAARQPPSKSRAIGAIIRDGHRMPVVPPEPQRVRGQDSRDAAVALSMPVVFPTHPIGAAPIGAAPIGARQLGRREHMNVKVGPRTPPGSPPPLPPGSPPLGLLLSAALRRAVAAKQSGAPAGPPPRRQQDPSGGPNSSADVDSATFGIPDED